MKILGQNPIAKADINLGQFNHCQHTFLEVEAGHYQTVSCLLPNGGHVTFAFVPGEPGSNEMECVDIHATVGRHWQDKATVGLDHYQQHLVGFCRGPDTFDTRRIRRPTGLATLLLHKHHHLS